MGGIEDVFGGAAILLGVISFFWKNKRKFDRTNAAGIEQFSSYVGKVWARFLDLILWVLAFASLTGGIVFLAHVHEGTWGWVVLLPIYAFMLIGIPLGRRK